MGMRSVILSSVSQKRHGRRRAAERFMKQGNKEERQPFFKFIDRKSYLLMAVMMGGGIALRAGGLAFTRSGNLVWCKLAVTETRFLAIPRKA